METDASSYIFDRGYREVLDVEVIAEQPVRIGTATGKFDACTHALLTFRISLRDGPRGHECRVQSPHGFTPVQPSSQTALLLLI